MKLLNLILMMTPDGKPGNNVSETFRQGMLRSYPWLSWAIPLISGIFIGVCLGILGSWIYAKLKKRKKQSKNEKYEDEE